MSSPPQPPPPKPLVANITLRPVPWDHPHSIHLRTLQSIELRSQGVREPTTPLSAASLPIFLIAYCDDTPAGCGGLRPLPLAGAAEVKRMFVLPAHRGLLRGADGTREGVVSVAGSVLGALEEEAKGRGWDVLFLETGMFMVGARRFYERCGFGECAVYAGCTGADRSVFYRKRIAGV